MGSKRWQRPAPPAQPAPRRKHARRCPICLGGCAAPASVRHCCIACSPPAAASPNSVMSTASKLPSAGACEGKTVRFARRHRPAAGLVSGWGGGAAAPLPHPGGPRARRRRHAPRALVVRRVCGVARVRRLCHTLPGPSHTLRVRGARCAWRTILLVAHCDHVIVLHSQVGELLSVLENHAVLLQLQRRRVLRPAARGGVAGRSGACRGAAQHGGHTRGVAAARSGVARAACGAPPRLAPRPVHRPGAAPWQQPLLAWRSTHRALRTWFRRPCSFALTSSTVSVGSTSRKTVVFLRLQRMYMLPLPPPVPLMRRAARRARAARGPPRRRAEGGPWRRATTSPNYHRAGCGAKDCSRRSMG